MFLNQNIGISCQRKSKSHIFLEFFILLDNFEHITTHRITRTEGLQEAKQNENQYIYVEASFLRNIKILKISFFPR